MLGSLEGLGSGHSQENDHPADNSVPGCCDGHIGILLMLTASMAMPYTAPCWGVKGTEAVFIFQCLCVDDY